MRAHYLMQRHECIAHCVIGLSLCIIDSIGRVLLSTPSLTETIRVGSFVKTGKKCIYSTGHALTPLTPLAKWQMASRNLQFTKWHLFNWKFNSSWESHFTNASSPPTPSPKTTKGLFHCSRKWHTALHSDDGKQLFPLFLATTTTGSKRLNFRPPM